MYSQIMDYYIRECYEVISVAIILVGLYLFLILIIHM